MTFRVWTEQALHPDALARLKAEVEVSEGGQRPLLPGADVAIIGSSTVDDNFLDQAGPNLKLVVRHGIGYDKVDVGAASARGILAANTPDGPTEGTAEHAVGLMLSVAKCIARSDRNLRSDGNWSAAKHRGIELRGRVLGLVGFGRIGRRVAGICGPGLGMQVVFYDPFLTGPPAHPSDARQVASLKELVAQADVISLHLGLSPETRHLFDAPMLKAMKPDAILINTSRGEIVDEAALARIVAEGHLRGAGIDVFDPEPPPPDNPLFHMENIVVTSHLASATIEASFRSSTGVVDQILQVRQGERPSWLIDASAWPGRIAAEGHRPPA